MRQFRLIAILLMFGFGFIASPARAQWTSIAPNLIGTGPYLNSGAMGYADGVAWAGLYDLYKSTDKGLTWQKLVLPNAGSNTLHGITFYDRNTGIVCSDAGVYVTHDQGTTWKTFFQGQVAFYGCFAGSPNAFVVGGIGSCSFTSDGGSTWNTHPFTRVAKDFYSPAPGSAIAFIESSDSHIAVTTDYGLTWVEKAGTMDADAHSFGVNQCDASTIFGINEEGGNYSSNGLAEIFRSTDGGATFTSIKQQSLASMSGCIAITPGAIYVPARTNGILQSIDNGATWQTIPGPNVPIDSRDFIVIDDTVLLAADINGTIWRSINHAGAGSVSSASNSLDVTSADVRNDTIGGTALVPLNFHRSGALSGLDLVLHYDWFMGLRYLGTFLTNGKQIDVAGKQTKGRSQLHLDAADLPAGGSDLIGYARFSLYFGEGGCANAWFDSLTFTTPPGACFRYSMDSAHSHVCSNQSLAGVTEASERTGGFTLSPNPTTSTAMLRSLSFNGAIVIRTINEVGVVVQESHQRIDPKSPVQLSLEQLPAGEYFIELQTGSTRETLRLLRLK